MAVMNWIQLVQFRRRSCYPGYSEFGSKLSNEDGCFLGCCSKYRYESVKNCVANRTCLGSSECCLKTSNSGGNPTWNAGRCCIPQNCALEGLFIHLLWSSKVEFEDLYEAHDISGHCRRWFQSCTGHLCSAIKLKLEIRLHDIKKFRSYLVNAI
jgi:hypothetical protein